MITGNNFIKNLIILFRSQGNYKELGFYQKFLKMILPLTVVQHEGKNRP